MTTNFSVMKVKLNEHGLFDASDIKKKPLNKLLANIVDMFKRNGQWYDNFNTSYFFDSCGLKNSSTSTWAHLIELQRDGFIKFILNGSFIQVTSKFEELCSKYVKA